MLEGKNHTSMSPGMMQTSAKFLKPHNDSAIWNASLPPAFLIYLTNEPLSLPEPNIMLLNVQPCSQLAYHVLMTNLLRG